MARRVLLVLALLPRAVAGGQSFASATPTEQLRLGMSLAARGEVDAAEAPLRAACAAVPQPEDACYFHGRNLFILGRYSEAVEPLQNALGPADATKRWRVHRAVAQNFQALGRAEGAERHYREAMKLSEDGGLRVDYGAFLFRQGRTEESLKMLEGAVKSGASPRANAELGRALLGSGRAAAALPHLESAVAASPNDWRVRLLLGKTYVQLGRTADGERELQLASQGLAAAPGSSTSR